MVTKTRTLSDTPVFNPWFPRNGEDILHHPYGPAKGMEHMFGPIFSISMQNLSWKKRMPGTGNTFLASSRIITKKDYENCKRIIYITPKCSQHFRTLFPFRSPSLQSSPVRPSTCGVRASTLGSHRSLEPRGPGPAASCLSKSKPAIFR